MTASVYSIFIQHNFATERQNSIYSLASIGAGFISSSCLADLTDAGQTFLEKIPM